MLLRIRYMGLNPIPSAKTIDLLCYTALTRRGRSVYLTKPDIQVTSGDVSVSEDISFVGALLAQALVEVDSELLCSPTIASTLLDRLRDLCEQIRLDQSKSLVAPTAHILLRVVEHNIEQLLLHDHKIGCTCAAKNH